VGRPADPTRAKRGTGHRPKPGEAKTAPAGRSNLPAVGGPAAAPSVPVPPDLPPSAQQMFARVVAELQPRGLREADLDAITMMCHSAWLHNEARRKLAETGVLVKGRNGQPMVNPLIKVARDEAATYLRLADAFGLTLASRLRLGLMQLTGESLLQSLNSDLDKRVNVQVQV
jgi:P27 family predicted phage terminase small subunit